MPAITTRQVLRVIRDPRLALYKGEGYWYFAFEEASTGKFDTKSVYTFRLSDMPVERWVEVGRDFIAEMEAREVPAPLTGYIRVGGSGL